MEENVITVKKGILEDIRPLLLVLVLLLDAVLAELGRQVDGILAVATVPLKVKLVPPEPERRRPARSGRCCRRRQRRGPATDDTVAAPRVVMLLVLLLLL